MAYACEEDASERADARPFLVSACDKSFTRSDALAKHMKISHHIIPPIAPRVNAKERPPDPTLASLSGGRAAPNKPSAEWDEEEADWSRMDLDLGGTGKVKREPKVIIGRGGKILKQKNKSRGPKKKEEANGAGNEDGGSDSDSDSGDSLTGYLMLPRPVVPEGEDDEQASFVVMSERTLMPRHRARFLIAKAKHQVVARERDELETTLAGLKTELRSVVDSKNRLFDLYAKRELT